MTTPIPSRTKLLRLSPADRHKCLETARCDIEREIEQTQAGLVRTWYGRSRRYHLQFLYSRRQQIAVLAEEDGCGAAEYS